MRGSLSELSGHKLAGRYRPQTPATHHRRSHPLKQRGEQYFKLWRVIDGAVRDALANHPEYLTELGTRKAQEGIVKRVTGAVHGHAVQSAWGLPETVADNAVEVSKEPHQPSRLIHWSRLCAWLASKVRCTNPVGTAT